MDSFLNKKDEFLTRIQESKPSIIGLTEINSKKTNKKKKTSKNNQNLNEVEYHIPNYDMFLNNNISRGVALYTEKSLNARECEELNKSEFQESVWCTFNDRDGNSILLGCIYRSPNTSTEINDNKMFDLLKSNKMLKFDKVLIMGDFNYPFVRWDGKWSGEKGEQIVEKIKDAYLIQKVDKPTRRRTNQNPTLDDWILINEENIISDIIHQDPVGKSDHDVLSFDLHISMNHDKKPKGRYTLNLNKGNYNQLRSIISNHDWTIMDQMNVEESWNHLKEVLAMGMEECIPKVKTGRGKNTKPIWMDEKAFKTIKKKHKMYKRYLCTKTGQDYLRYIEIRNLSNKLIKKCRKNYEREIGKESKKNPKKFWKYIKDKIKTNIGIGTLKRKDGSLADNDKDKAETLNDFFSSVFTREDPSSVPILLECSRSNEVSICDVRVTTQAVINKLKELNPNKSQGPDLIPPRVLKEICNEIASPLGNIFNKSLETGTLPEDWKTAEVTAIFKKGSKTDPGNYRPVSLTCIACKILESFIRDVIVAHFTDNDLYAKCQHGFRKKRSCVTQLLEVIDNLTELLDKGEPIDIVYLDFRKAFDSVPHERLLTKLKAYGVTGNVLNWIMNFLKGRSQLVRVGEERSKKSEVLSGIPQGSILGPILFTVFINDLPDMIQTTCKIFADDTKIYDKATNSTKIQQDINKLQVWSDEWNLYFNVAKCKVMHIGKNNAHFEYTMIMNEERQKINVCDEEKDLGVTFDKNLSFDPHIQRVVNKGNQMMGLIRRTFTYLEKETFTKLYKAFVRPHIEYANVIWSPHLKRQSKMIENVQRRATKILRECKNLSYEERLHYLQLHSLKGRRIRGDLIQFFKIFHNYDDVNVHALFKFSEIDYTRNKEGKIFIRHCYTNKRKFSFAFRIANYWNALPTNTKYAPDVNNFKKLLDEDPKLKDLFYNVD